LTAASDSDCASVDVGGAKQAEVGCRTRYGGHGEVMRSFEGDVQAEFKRWRGDQSGWVVVVVVVEVIVVVVVRFRPPDDVKQIVDRQQSTTKQQQIKERG